MRALCVTPGRQNSAALLDIAHPPREHQDGLLVETLALGVCGTDLEIVDGLYGVAPEGQERLVLGHESLGRVLEAPPGGSWSQGDMLVGIVRRPDPLPCSNCAVGEWDMCRNGQYTERGIKGLDGFGAERFRIDPAYAVKVEEGLGLLGVLVEPASVIAKAWEQIERIGSRAHWRPRKVLVTGAGPIGLLAALFGVQRGLDVHVLDRVTEGPKPGLVQDLGATYHTSSVQEAGRGADIVIECTGVGELVLEAMQVTGHVGIVCLTGLSPGGRALKVDAAALNRDLVLENDVVFGSVNANRRHYEAAAAALRQADRAWVARLITRRVPLVNWRQALQRFSDDVKVVIEFAEHQWPHVSKTTR